MPRAQDDAMQMTQDDLQHMMDRIQDLMEEDHMAEAEQGLQELQEMMENMQVAEGQQGEGPQSEGQKAMEGLEEALRGQQGLSDQAFCDLQEQYNLGAQAGKNQCNEGRNGGQDSGQSEGQGLAQRQEDLRREVKHQRGALPGAGSEAGDVIERDDLAELIDQQVEAMDALRDGMRNLAEAMAEAQGRQAKSARHSGWSRRW